MKLTLNISRFASIGVLTLVVAIGFNPEDVSGQERVWYYDYMRQDLEWYSIETEHFLIHFHADSTGSGADRTAQVVARVAEDVYGPITDLYDYEPDTKVSIVLKDFEDYSNGAAYFFDNKIDIWAPSLATPLRGEHAWLRNVITHEFTHIVQVQKTMKGSRRWPFYYFQWLAYEDVRRPDVLYGYPDILVSYPVPVLNNPAWFAEGTAQFQRSDLHYDNWDTHRDMLLRARFLGGHDLSLESMGDLHSKTSIQREQVYNQGFSFTTYLANEYGEEVLRDISDKLGNWLNWTFQDAAGDVLDEDPNEVFERWASGVKQGYLEATEQIRSQEVSGRLIEEGGSFNFSPRFSPDGSRVAYTSSKGGDYSQTYLYVTSVDGDRSMSLKIDGLDSGDGSPYHQCSLGSALARVTGSIDWSPDGEKIVYARSNDTDKGYLFNDLYEIDVATEKERRITTQLRASSPSYAPGGDQLVYVGQGDGSTNLYLIDVDGKSGPSALTHFEDGTQVYAPRWHPDGSAIYFARGPAIGGRDIYRIRPDGTGLEAVIATSADERDPVVSGTGFLYFASDRTGIYNVNRIPLNSIGDPGSIQGVEQLTNVSGGAFAPAVRSDGKLVYSFFGPEGYKIALIEAPTALQAIPYSVPDILKKRPANPTAESAEIARLNEFDDSDLVGWPRHVFTPQPESRDDGEPVYPAPQPDPDGPPPDEYGDTFSSFQFFPVLRFDMYANAERAGLDRPGERAFQAGELLRNTKVGLYINSREVLDGLSFTAGLQLGLWSRSWDSFGDFLSPGRLDKIERDVFFRFDYRKGLPFLKKRWAPQLSVEFYNVVRNVENGLSIEEFPCTACYPDTTYADISYSLWEVDVYSRSKLNRSMLLEIGYRYSPYRARTETFFSEEEGISIPSSSTRYFIGHAIGAKLYVEGLRPHLNDDVLPIGVRAQFGYEYQPGRLLEDFTVENGLLVPEYVSSRNHQLVADVRLGFKLPFGGRYAAHGLGVRVRGTTILGGAVDSFYNDYVGGLVGARGYPFYALGGNETAWAQLSYQFPIFGHIGEQLLFLHLNKLYGRVYADAAAAWTTETPDFDEIRTDVGAELRLGISSFYILPTAVFLSATYGLNDFTVRLDDGFVTPDGSQFVQYGRQLLWHFGVLFEFDL